MTADYAKPLPEVTEDNAPFWEGCKRRQLLLQRCGKCGHHRDASPVCPLCLAPEHDWVAASGRGSVYSWVVVHQRYSKAFEDDLPYNVAIVELEEGPRLMSNVVGIPNEEIRAGLDVEVTWDEVTDEITLPRFRPRA